MFRDFLVFALILQDQEYCFFLSGKICEKTKRDGRHLNYRGSSFVLLNVPIITIVHGKTANLAFCQKKRGLTFRHFNLEVIPFYLF